MKFLVSGLGSIGLRHAKNLIALDHEVYGEDPELSRAAEAESLGVKIFKGELLRSVDATIIATPTHCHAKQLGFAISMGWHCLVEKPIAEEYEIGLDLVLALAKKKNLVVMVGNNLRFHPHVIMAKKICEQESPARGTFIISQYNDRLQYLKDGVILNWLAHELDLALYLLGPANVVAACANKHQTIASVFLEHKSGACSTVYGDYLGDPEERMFKLQCPMSKQVHILDLKNYGYEYDFNQTYFFEIEEFIDRINGRIFSYCGATGQDGLETLKLITAATEMAK